MTNYKLPAFRVELKIFTRFVFGLLFRVSGRSVPQDIPLTYRCTQFTCNFQVLSVKTSSSATK